MNFEKFEKKVDEMTDEEVLTTFSILLRDRAKIGTGLVNNEMGLVVGAKTIVVSGQLMMEGEPAMFSWPLQQLPLPDAFKDDYPEQIN